jgi:hypothetical protein
LLSIPLRSECSEVIFPARLRAKALVGSNPRVASLASRPVGGRDVR